MVTIWKRPSAALPVPPSTVPPAELVVFPSKLVAAAVTPSRVPFGATVPLTSTSLIVTTAVVSPLANSCGGFTATVAPVGSVFRSVPAATPVVK